MGEGVASIRLWAPLRYPAIATSESRLIRIDVTHLKWSSGLRFAFRPCANLSRQSFFGPRIHLRASAAILSCSSGVALAS